MSLTIYIFITHDHKVHCGIVNLHNAVYKMCSMESMTYDTHNKGSDSKVPLIKDYNNITPSEIENVLKILTKKCNDYAPQEKKRKNKNINVNCNPGLLKKPQLLEIPECCIKLQSELNTNPMIHSKKELLKKKCLINCSTEEKGLPSKSISISQLTARVSSSKRKQNNSRISSKCSKGINNSDLTGNSLHVPEKSSGGAYIFNECCDDNLPLHNNKTSVLPESQSHKSIFTTRHCSLPCKHICITLDSSDEDVSETLVQDCYSNTENDPITTSKHKEENFIKKGNESITLSDSEESEVEFIPADTCNVTEIMIDDEVQSASTVEEVQTVEKYVQSFRKVDKDVFSVDTVEDYVQSVHTVEEDVQSVHTVEEDVQSVHTVEEDVQSVHTVEEDVQSVSTVEDDLILQKWRDKLKKKYCPCVLISSDDESVYDLQPNENIQFYEDNLKTSFECPVCLENIINCTNLSSTICGHVFCTNCIIKSIANYKKCPSCNYNLELSLVHPVYLNFI